MKPKQNILCLCALLFCVLALLLVEELTQPRKTTPQALLTAEQREELYRFPKSILDATKDDLQQVEGIGAQRAEAILRYLHSHELTSMSQLLEVEGVGEGLLEELKKYFYFR